MTIIVIAASVVLAVIATSLRYAAASLLVTPRADALHDAADEVAGAARVAHLLEDRPIIQPAVGMVHAALLIATAIPATWALTALMSGVPLAVSLVALSIALVLVADTLPRALGKRRPRRPAYRFSRLLEVAIDVGDWTADLIVEDEVEEEDEPDHDEVDAAEIELISSVLDFTDAIVREVMVPRTDMITIESTATTDDALDLVIAAGRSRIPVTGDGIDDIVGVLYARDLLRLVDDGSGVKQVDELMRRAHFVPESKRVSELLRELQSDKVHLAIVVDEFGTTAGLVTIEDLLEELVGEIVDEYDVEEPLITELEDAYLLDARLPIDDFAELMGVEFDEEEWDTVGGLVLALAGRVPEEGEAFALGEVTLVAERIQGRRIAQVRIPRR